MLFIYFFFSGKYMQMMNILKPIAFDVIHFMSQLFDYYLYAIYTFFGRNDSVSQSLGEESVSFKICFCKCKVHFLCIKYTNNIILTIIHPKCNRIIDTSFLCAQLPCLKYISFKLWYNRHIVYYSHFWQKKCSISF